MAISKTGNFVETPADGFLGIGHNAVGGLTVNGGSVLVLDDPDNSADPYFVFGRNAGGNGTGLITGAGSEVRLIGSGVPNEGATIHVGRLGTGSLSVTNGGALTISDTLGGATTYVGMAVARETGTGSFVVNSGTVNFTGAGTYLHVGRNGGTGTATIQNGSNITLNATAFGEFSGLAVGREGGTGTLTIDNSNLTLSSANGGANLGIGVGDFTGGDGTVIVRNGGNLTLNSTDSFLRVGTIAGASGELQILSGGAVQIIDTVDNPFGGSAMIGEFAGIAKAEVLVSGTGSLLDADSFVGIGDNPFGGPVGVGNGLVTLSNGGELRATDVAIGAGGVLVSAGGVVTISSHLSVSGGTIRLSSGGGGLEVDGGVTGTGMSVTEGGRILYEIAANGSGAGPLFLNGGNFFVDGTSSIAIQVAGGYQFASGQSYTLGTAAAGGDIFFEDTVTAANFSINGQAAGFGYMFATTGQNLIFQALNSGNGNGSATLDFGGASTIAATFVYDAAQGGGVGTGGAFDQLAARNLDMIRGTAAGDTLTINGNALVTLFGGGGNDSLTGGSAADTLYGVTGDDTLNGGGGNDILSGGSGVDAAGGGIGNDTVFGGAGADTLNGNDGDDTASGGADNDTVNGGAGSDDVFGGGGNDSMNGDAGIDILSGGGGNDVGRGGSENDTVYGGAGTDSLFGDAGNDTLSGGAGNDVLRGGDGNDQLLGGVGLDNLDGGAGTDTLVGGTDADIFIFALAYNNDTVSGFQDDVDTIRLDDALWGGGKTVAQVLTDHATQTSPGIIDFDFGNGDTLRVVQGSGIAVAALENDIVIV